MPGENNTVGGPSHAPPLPPFAWGGIAVLVVVKVLMHLPVHPAYGYFRDEFYYMACADRLAWGYVDHPPLSLAILAATRMLLGDSLWAIRLPVVLAGAVSLVLTALLAREMGGHRYAQFLAALALLIAPVYMAMGTFFSMNTFEQVSWPLCAWLLVRLVRTGNANHWLWFGLVAGLGLLNKHSMVIFGFALMAALLLTPNRTHFLKPQLYLGGAIAFVLFVPHLVWQVTNGFPTLEFMQNAQANKMIAHGAPAFLAGQVLLLHPLNLLLWPVGLGALLFAPWLRPYRVLGIAFLVVIAINLLSVAKTYYPNPAYPMLFAAAGMAYARWFEAPRLRPLRFALPALLVAGGAALAPLTLPFLAPETLLSYTATIGISAPREERSHQRLALDQHIADRIGWPEMVDGVALAAERLDPEERARAAVYSSNYGQAGAVEFLGKDRNLPRSISGHNSYWMWGPGADAVSALITVGVSAERLAETFDSVEVVTVVETPYAVESPLTICICRGPKLPIGQVWPQLKLYI